jgi:hypothetical protein
MTTHRWAQVSRARVALGELEHECTPLLCKACHLNMLPTRERLRTVLDGAVEQLNAAKLRDTLRGTIPDGTIESLAGMAYALLYAGSMLEHCEPCIAIKLEVAAALIVGRLEG